LPRRRADETRLARRGDVLQNARMTPSNRWVALVLGTLIGLQMTTNCAAAPRQGDVPPPDVGRTLAGDEILLSNYAGKAVIVTFWATWCPYCIKELPILQNVQDQVGKEQMEVIAVNTETFDVYKRATRIMRESMHMELVSDASGQAQSAFGVRTLPHMLIIGRDGRVLRVYHGYDERKLDAIVADINRALKPLPGSAP